jgi:hypothetical protein
MKKYIFFISILSLLSIKPRFNDMFDDIFNFQKSIISNMETDLNRNVNFVDGDTKVVSSEPIGFEFEDKENIVKITCMFPEWVSQDDISTFYGRNNEAIIEINKDGLNFKAVINEDAFSVYAIYQKNIRSEKKDFYGRSQLNQSMNQSRYFSSKVNIQEMEISFDTKNHMLAIEIPKITVENIVKSKIPVKIIN